MTNPVLSLSDLEVGQVLASREIAITRDTLVRYAGASGDFNAIHYNDAVAEQVGLPGVIAHGMLTMGTAITVVTDATGDPAAIRSYSTRFTKPVPVPALGAAALLVTVTVRGIDAAAGTAELDLTAESGGAKVLGKARAVVALPGTVHQPGTADENGAAGAGAEAAHGAGA